MVRKLSHRIDSQKRPTAAAHAIRRPRRLVLGCDRSRAHRHPGRLESWRILLTTIAAAALAGACNPVESERALAEAELDGKAEQSQTTEPGSGEPFVWPRSAPHPRLILEVEMKHRSGTIEIELMPELAGTSVDAVVQIARTGAYDGTTFHRVIPDFMIQGGDPNSRDMDPTNDGRGGVPIAIPDEGRHAPLERGSVALANRGTHNSNSTQFFIMQSKARALDGRYNVIGRVTKGMDLVDAIAAMETDRAGRWGPKDRPLENILIRSATVVPEPAGS